MFGFISRAIGTVGGGEMQTYFGGYGREQLEKHGRQFFLHIPLTLRRLGPKSDHKKIARIIHCAQRA